jgi:hypothetical protein
MTSLAPLSGPLGVTFRNEDALLKAAGGAIAVGTLVVLSSANTDHPLIFDTATAATAVDGTASDLHLIYGVAISAATAAGDKLMVRIKGQVDATTGGSVSDADTLIAGAGVLVTGAAEASADKAQKVIAVALQTDVGTTASVLIDGVNGLGSLPVT